MTQRTSFDRIDLHLIRVLHTLITERNVSRTAVRLQSTQPAVSAQLKRLRALTGDPLLVRAGNGMMPTAAALEMVTYARQALQAADTIFNPQARPGAFEPATSDALFRIAASDYLDPQFLPALVEHVKRAAPGVRLELLPLSSDFDYRRALADGAIDLVIGNWLKPPAELHLGRLVSDEVVCLVAATHPLLKIAATRQWSVARYLASEHIAPARFHPGGEGFVDDHLETLGLRRELAVRCAYFSLIPAMVERSRMVLTTGRLYCNRAIGTAGVRIIRCPVAFPVLRYYQLWHDLTHASPPLRWLREQTREVARALVPPPSPYRRAIKGAE
ncbi:MAG: LysR family transcriptional regulator [Lautropia sp.]